MKIGRKFFIVASNFEAWKAKQGKARIGERNGLDSNDTAHADKRESGVPVR